MSATESARGSDVTRQILVIAAFVFMIIGDAVGLGAFGGTPIQDAQGGSFSPDTSYLTPATEAFAIWTPIYLGLAIYVIWQALPSQRARDRQRSLGWLIALTMVLNGALAGLVSITAEPLAPSLFGALWIGAIGGVIVVLTVPMLDKMKIDDVVGAIPVHLFAGIWGTIAVVFYNSDANIVTQITGIIAYGVFTFVGSLVLWFIIKAVLGLRVSEEDEIAGLDMSELGMEAYPEFSNA